MSGDDGAGDAEPPNDPERSSLKVSSRALSRYPTITMITITQ